jgi:hypothetical protein
MNLRIGEDVIVDGMWGEIVEIFSNGNILVEFPNRRRKVITKTELGKVGV